MPANQERTVSTPICAHAPRVVRLRLRIDDWLTDPARILVIVLMVAAAAVFIYRHRFGPDLVMDHEKWGQFGDSSRESSIR